MGPVAAPAAATLDAPRTMTSTGRGANGVPLGAWAHHSFRMRSALRWAIFLRWPLDRFA